MSARVIQCSGTYSRPPPTGTGAVGINTARQRWPLTSTGTSLPSKASAALLPSALGPPKWHHTALIERRPSPCASLWENSATNLRSGS